MPIRVGAPGGPPGGPGTPTPIPAGPSRFETQLHEDVRDVYNGDPLEFVDARNALAREAAEALDVQEANPEAARNVLDNLDADVQLFINIHASRRGMRGLITHGKESLQGSWLGRRTADVAKIGSSVVAGSIIGKFTRGVLKLANPVAGAVGGGVMGSVYGYLHGKNQQESAATWMADLGILNMDMAEIRELSTSELMYALGIMRNAIVGRRVRGNDQARTEMALKYRYIKSTLNKRRNEAVTNNETEMSPALQAIDNALATSRDELDLISAAAGERTRGDYDTIIHDKRGIVRMSALKGAAVGAGLGAVAGWAVPKLMGWISQHAPGLAHSLGISSGDPTDALRSKMEALRHSPGVLNESAIHDANMATYHGAYGGDINPATGAAYPDIDVSSLPPDQQHMFGWLTDLRHAQGAASWEGLAHSSTTLPSADLSHLQTMLHGGNIHGVQDFLVNHNIDPTQCQFLVDHQAAFLHLPPDVQHFVLSHPGIAPEIFNVDSNATINSINALMEKYAVPLALGGAVVSGGTFAAAGARQGTLKRHEAGVIGTSQREARAEERENLEKRQTALRESLVGSRITLNVAFITDQIRNTVPAPSRPGVTPRPDGVFEVQSIDDNGDIHFVSQNSTWDLGISGMGGNPYPVINISEITNHDQAGFNTARASRETTATDLLAARERETQSLEGIRAKLVGAEVDFDDAFLTSVGYSATGSDRRLRYTVVDLDPSRDAQIMLNRRYSTDMIPAFNLSQIIEETPGSPNVYRIRGGVLNVVRPATPAPGAPLVPGTPPTPTSPAVPASPDQATLDAEMIANPANRVQEGKIVRSGGRLVFRAASPIALLGSADIPLDSSKIPTGADGLPRLRATLTGVKVDASGKPEFNADFEYEVTGSPPATYEVKQKFTVGGKKNAARDGFFNEVEFPDATLSRNMIHVDANPNYLRLIGVKLAAAGSAAGMTEYTFEQIDPATGTVVVGSKALKLTRARLEGIDFVQLKQV